MQDGLGRQEDLPKFGCSQLWPKEIGGVSKYEDQKSHHLDQAADLFRVFCMSCVGDSPQGEPQDLLTEWLKRKVINSKNSLKSS